MNLRLRRLATEPALFTPIDFHTGINLILGEKVEKAPMIGVAGRGQKVNGVGKSLCVEFLHFGLLRDLAKTRIANIPPEQLPHGLVVVLDLTIGNEKLQIRRKVDSDKQPIIVRNERSTTFDNLEEANRFLGDLLFADSQSEFRSFRSLMSLLMRDERSEFSDILTTMPSNVKAQPDLSPHLYLLGFEVAPYSELLKSISTLEQQTKLAKSIEKSLTNDGKTPISNIQASLEIERREAEQITVALAQLQAEPAFAQVEVDLNRIEASLAELRAKRKSVNFKLEQILALPQPETIDEVDLKIIYDRVRSGLGELVTKSLEQARNFKAEIEAFQRSLLSTERDELRKTQQKLTGEIRKLSIEHATLLKQVDRNGVLKELTTGLAIASKTQNDYFRKEALHHQWKEAVDRKANFQSDRQNKHNEVRLQIDSHKNTIREFNDTIVAIHERINDNPGASFNVRLNDSIQAKHPMTFDYRATDDGSYSINRTKVFIYDCALMFADCTQPQHPRFLLHDNIFDVDQDTLVQCLNYLNDQMKAGEDFQYILTLNREKIEVEERTAQIKFDVDKATVARFTKTSKFLGFTYQEGSKAKR